MTLSFFPGLLLPSWIDDYQRVPRRLLLSSWQLFDLVLPGRLLLPGYIVHLHLVLWRHIFGSK